MKVEDRGRLGVTLPSGQFLSLLPGSEWKLTHTHTIDKVRKQQNSIEGGAQGCRLAVSSRGHQVKEAN